MSDPRQVPTAHEALGEPSAGAPYDPLRLCVFATVALIAWVLGPVALVVFALLGAVGYVRARRAGLLRSRCKLGDTRLVIAYLVLLVLLGSGGHRLRADGRAPRCLNHPWDRPPAGRRTPSSRQPPSGMSNSAKFWIGVVLALPAAVLGSVLVGILSGVGSALDSSGTVSGILGGVGGFLELAAVVVGPRAAQDPVVRARGDRRHRRPDGARRRRLRGAPRGVLPLLQLTSGSRAIGGLGPRVGRWAGCE